MYFEQNEFVELDTDKKEIEQLRFENKLTSALVYRISAVDSVFVLYF